MSTDELFPGCSVRWEDGRPFEVEVAAGLARDPETRRKVARMLLALGWRVRLAHFGRDGSRAFALVVECSPAPVTT